MERVVTINLNGNAYQLDEAAFSMLRAYLDQAEAQLKDNPDRLEIFADLEQAIAEKCRRFLGPHKTVVTAAEMDQVVREMGPVEGTDSKADGAAAETDSAAAKQPGGTGSKRLYRLREGAMFAGVCNGIAAYLHLDVVFVRIAVVGLVVASFGWAILGYWILVLVIPEAQTADEHAAAHGQAPFSAQDVIDEVKRTAARFKDANLTGGQWPQHMRDQRRQWRSQSRAWRRQWRETAGDPHWWSPGIGVPPVSFPMPAAAGFLLPVFSLVNLALFIGLVLTILSLVNTGAIYGWPLPAGMPMWAGILILVVLFHFVASPIRAARHASRYVWGRYYGFFAVWDGLFVAGVTVLGVWLVSRHMPPVDDLQEFMQHLPDAIRAAGREIVVWIRGE